MADQYIYNVTFLLSQAYDGLVFPARKRLADRNTRRLLNGRLPRFTAHHLEKLLPLDIDNPNNDFNRRDRRRRRRR